MKTNEFDKNSKETKIKLKIKSKKRFKKQLKNQFKQFKQIKQINSNNYLKQINSNKSIQPNKIENYRTDDCKQSFYKHNVFNTAILT